MTDGRISTSSAGTPRSLTWAVGLESRVSPGLAPTAAPLLHLTLLDGAAGRLTAPFVRRILTLAAHCGHLTPDATTTSDLCASATKAADQLSSRHVGAGHWLLLQSSALTAEDGLDFLGGSEWRGPEHWR